MPKKIVVCCDGTWNKADQKDPTNVKKIQTALIESDQQVVGYVKGVGADPGAFEKYFGGVFGFGLSARLQEAYQFVTENYEEEDQIYLLGFSRGAYTARSLAGMIRNVGILKPRFRNKRYYRKAMAIYRNRRPRGNEPDGAKAIDFRRKYSVSPGIRFIGVWDTVGALGIPLGGLRWLNFLNRRWQFHDTQLSSTVQAAYHALAIDERRAPFKPTLWKLSEKALNQQVKQTVEQVWFSGVHSNIGGGYPDSGLSDIALNWMAGKAFDHGLHFTAGPPVGQGRARALAKWVAPGARPEGKLVDSRTGFYLLLPEHVRRLGRTHSSTSEAAFFTAERRLNDDPDYRSWAVNLGDYLRGRVLPKVEVLPSGGPRDQRGPATPTSGELDEAA